MYSNPTLVFLGTLFALAPLSKIKSASWTAIMKFDKSIMQPITQMAWRCLWTYQNTSLMKMKLQNYMGVALLRRLSKQFAVMHNAPHLADDAT
jgi:hypothetical protein